MALETAESINTAPPMHPNAVSPVIQSMARIASASSPSTGRTGRSVRAFAALLVALGISGCETLERVDVLDRVFDPSLRSRPWFASEPPPRPSIASATGMGVAPGSAQATDSRFDPQPATGWGGSYGSVVAMEPRPDAPSATGWNAQPTSQVVAMEPVPNPPATSAAERPTQTARLRVPEPRSAEPAPIPAAASATAIDPEARTRSLVRQNQWLTRFWMELTPSQQARVQQRLRSGGMVLAADSADPAMAWDGMGLSDRAKLVFGTGQPSDPPAPIDRRDGSTWARSY